MLNFARREPALVVAAVVAILSVVVAFGLPVTHDQKAAIVGVVNAVLAIIGGLTVRAKVSPVTKAPDAPAQSTEAGAVDVLTIALVALIVVVILVLLHAV